MPPSRNKSGSNARFPVRLHHMMTFAEEQGLESVVGWVLGGRGFIIYDADKLGTHILPHFFGKTKYKSFLRQLHMWDFERVSHGPNKGMYMHPYFIKDNIDLCGHMTRQMTRQMKDYFIGDTGKEKMTAAELEAKINSFQSEIKKCDRLLRKDKRTLPTTTTPRHQHASTTVNKHATTAEQGSSSSFLGKECQPLRNQQQGNTASALKTTGINDSMKSTSRDDSSISSPSALSSLSMVSLHESAFSLDLVPPPTIDTARTTSRIAGDVEMEVSFRDNSSANIKQYDGNPGICSDRRKSPRSFSQQEASTAAVSGEDKKPPASTGGSESNMLDCFAGKQFFVVKDNSI